MDNFFEMKPSFREFRNVFNNNVICEMRLEELRWPNGFVCPECKSDQSWKIKNGKHKCARCHKVSSLTSGTIFHRSKIDLYTWFIVSWAIFDARMNQNFQVNANWLMNQLCIKSYHTIWEMLHKIRKIMEKSVKPLNGNIKLALMELPVRRSNPVREEKKNEIVLIAVEFYLKNNIKSNALKVKTPEGSTKSKVGLTDIKNNSSAGRIYMIFVDNPTDENICKLLNDAIDKGSTIHVPVILKDLDPAIKQKIVNEKRQPSFFDDCRKEKKAFQTWLTKTYRTYTTNTQLRYYLAEYCFRINHKNSKSNKNIFDTFIEICATTPK